MTCKSKITKIVPNPEIEDGRHLENLFFACSPEPKGQLTPNLVGSIRVSVDQKQLKSCRSEIQARNLVGSIGVTFRLTRAGVCKTLCPKLPDSNTA